MPEEESHPTPYPTSPPPHPCWKPASYPLTRSASATGYTGSYSAQTIAASAVASHWDESKNHSTKGSVTSPAAPGKRVWELSRGAPLLPEMLLPRPAATPTCSHDGSECSKSKPTRDHTELPRLPCGAAATVPISPGKHLRLVFHNFYKR